MTFDHPEEVHVPRTVLTPRRRVLLAVSSPILVATLAACGGGSSGGHDMGGTSSSTAAAAGGASASPSGTMSRMGMAASPTYPPVTPGPAATGAHNDTDVMFANDMIPHHGQAVVMADMILARTDNPQVKTLAENIKKAQTPEIATMSGWLKGWGQAVPDPYGHAAGMSGMDHNGMMSDAQMKQLSDAMGKQADKVFLTLMIDHHQGAIDMGKTELAQGSNAQVKKLAQAIVTTQTAEIAQMKTLLKSV
jgi:uncharacterized protein (DUF305 family)